MPTGYTADIATGKVADFPTFAMQCARAFGALIEMRDEPFDAEPPKAFEPSTFNAERLAEARAELARLRRLSPSDAEVERDAAEAERKERMDERERNRAAQGERYRQMLRKVSEWEPPTADHQEMKRFMVEQLTNSIDFDCQPMTFDADPLPPAPEWLRTRIAKAERDVEYHAKEHQKEVERTRGRNEWLRDLRQSLGLPA